MFELTDRYVNAEVREAFKHGVERMRDQAIRNAPVDEHRLEDAIHLRPYAGNQYFVRAILDVSGSVRGRDVSAYATIVHEYPWSKRGPKTRAKGREAGPRYLTRAVSKHQKQMLDEIGDAMSAAIGRSVRHSGVNVRKRR